VAVACEAPGARPIKETDVVPSREAAVVSLREDAAETQLEAEEAPKLHERPSSSDTARTLESIQNSEASPSAPHSSIQRSLCTLHDDACPKVLC